MDLCHLNPHVRFASALRYAQQRAVKVTDCRLLYILEGRALLSIGNSQYSLEPGSVFYCCAGSEYTIQNPDDLSLICVNFDLDQSWNHQVIPLPRNTNPEEWPSMPVFFTSVEGNSFLNGHVFISQASDLYGLFRGIVSDFSDDPLYGRMLASAGLKNLLIRMHRAEPRELPPKICLVRDYIQQHYREDLTNKMLADLAGYHEYYLNRLFTACLGTGLHSYLLKQRLMHASYLILNTDIALTSIPEEVGFKSYPHFSACFKQAYGFSPAQYRKNLRN